jgi:hypothetical protein
MRWRRNLVGAKKKYADPGYYESKLEKVMDRLGAERYEYNFDRHGCWVEFFYKKQMYRFDNTVETAREHGQDLIYGSDAFAQVVLALEDLTRIVERGIYDLSTWVAGMKYLPPPEIMPECFRVLGFERTPESVGEIRARYKALAKAHHPDAGGSDEDFNALQKAADQAIRHIESTKR